VTVELELRGVRRMVDVRRLDAESWAVVVDGRAYRVGVTPTGTRWTLRLAEAAATEGEVGAPVRTHDIGFDGGRGSDLAVHVDGVPVALAVVDPRTARRSRAGGPVAGATTVVAPMPGRLVKVLVAPGHHVEARQPLIVIEAMKMQNELRAPRAGIVREIAAAEGQIVDGGAVLVVFE
jgi:biotin carboxyl carrier protein